MAANGHYEFVETVLADTRNRAVDAVLSKANAEAPGILPEETTPPNSTEYGEILQTYATEHSRYGGYLAIGRLRTLESIGHSAVGDSLVMTTQECIERETEARQVIYSERLEAAKRGNALKQALAFSPDGDIKERILRLVSVISARTEEIPYGYIVTTILFGNTLYRLRTEKDSLLTTASARPRRFGRWAMDSSMRTS